MSRRLDSPPSSPKAAEAVATYAGYIEANCSGRALEMLWSLQHRVKSDCTGDCTGDGDGDSTGDGDGDGDCNGGVGGEGGKRGVATAN